MERIPILVFPKNMLQNLNDTSENLSKNTLKHVETTQRC